MNKLKSIIALSLLALSAFSTGTPPQNIPITGAFDPDLPGHFIASTPLEIGATYTFRNNTGETIYVWLLNGRTPSDYFPLLKGGSQTLTATVGQFDIYDLSTIKNVSLVRASDNMGNR